MNYAIVQNAIVINVVVWDGVTPWQPPDDCEMALLTGGAGIGWGYVNGQFIPPPEPEPQEPEAVE